MVQQEEDGDKEELLGSSRLSKYICVCASADMKGTRRTWD